MLKYSFPCKIRNCYENAAGSGNFAPLCTGSNRIKTPQSHRIYHLDYISYIGNQLMYDNHVFGYQLATSTEPRAQMMFSRFNALWKGELAVKFKSSSKFSKL